MTPRLYYLGPAGTFGEQAAIRYQARTGLSLPTSPLESHDLVIQAAASAQDALGVVAIENSLGGAVNDVMDGLLATPALRVCAEIVVPIEHQLIVAPGTNLQSVEVVMSHPQAIAQCQLFLQKHLPSARMEAALSTVAAVQEALATPGVAAIASRRAAEIHGAEVIAESIQDVDNNKTRFFVVGHTDAKPTGDDKTSIAFTVADRPGSLVAVMQHLSTRGLNLTRIESRPSREELGKYIFLIDFQGHRSEDAAADALEAMKGDDVALLPGGEPLGSYPRFQD